MRKIKICVATLLLGGFCYGQNVDAYKKQVFDRQTELFEESVKEFQQLNFLIEDIVDNLRKDMHYGHITINVVSCKSVFFIHLFNPPISFIFIPISH